MYFMEYSLFADENSATAVWDRDDYNDIKFEIFHNFYDDYQIYDLVKQIQKLTRRSNLSKIQISELPMNSQIIGGNIIPLYQDNELVYKKELLYERIYSRDRFMGTIITKDTTFEFCKKIVEKYHSKFKGEFWECYDRAIIRNSEKK